MCELGSRWHWENAISDHGRFVGQTFHSQYLIRQKAWVASNVHVVKLGQRLAEGLPQRQALVHLTEPEFEMNKYETTLHLRCMQTMSEEESLTFPVPPGNGQRCSWLLWDTLPSASCLYTCMSYTCCAEESRKT